MDDANRIALDKAFELYAKHQGQPWSAENLVTAAETFRVFLDSETTMEPLLARIEALEETVYPPRTGDPAVKPTRPRSASAATNTTPPDDEPLDLTPDDVPTPVDF